MSKTKIIDTWFDNKNNVSCVIKSSPYGHISGMAYLHEEDADIANEFTGCTIAERRADMKIQQARAKHLRERANAMREMWLNLVQRMSQDFDTEIPEEYFKYGYYLFKMYKNAEKQADDAHKKYLEMRRTDKEFANKLVEQKREYRKKMDEHFKNKSE